MSPDGFSQRLPMRAVLVLGLCLYIHAYNLGRLVRSDSDNTMRETAWAGVGTHDTTRCASSVGQTRWYRRNEILEASDLNQGVLAVVPHACASESVLSRFEDTAHAHCAPALRDVVVLARHEGKAVCARMRCVQ